MKQISIFVAAFSIFSAVSCRRADYECHCEYPDGSHQVYPIGPTSQKDAKDDCEFIKKDTHANDCDFVVMP